MKQRENTHKRKKTDWRRVMTSAIVVLMVLALVLPLFSGVFSVQAATKTELQNQISGLKDDAAAAATRKKELEAQVAAIQADEAKALERKNLLAEELYAIEDQIANTQEQIDAYTLLIAEQETALAQAQAEETAAYEMFCRRARAMEEAGEISYWSVLFAASDYADLLDRLALVDEIMAYDNSVVENLAAARTVVEEELASLNEFKTGLDEQKAVLDAQRIEQEAKVAESQALFDQLKQQADAKEALLAAEKAEEERVAKLIESKQRELDQIIAMENIGYVVGDGYAYALPGGYYNKTSNYGWRTDPFSGYRDFHLGLDIAAPGGTEIYAAKGGVVLISAYAPRSYGNYVVISHGTGHTTLYAHMTSRAVSEGDVVSQGQVIGYVGTTGSSTGNHLHVELKINNTRQDPETKMYPYIDFY